MVDSGGPYCTRGETPQRARTEGELLGGGVVLDDDFQRRVSRHDQLHRLRQAVVDGLMYRIRRHIYEVARCYRQAVIEPLSSEEPPLTLQHVNGGLAVYVGSEARKRNRAEWWRPPDECPRHPPAPATPRPAASSRPTRPPPQARPALRPCTLRRDQYP